MKHLDKRQIVGWIAVGFSTVITCLWAFWGIIENFHEGWYYESLQSNVTGCTTKTVIPYHFNNDILWIKRANPADDDMFKRELEKIGLECMIMKYGDEIVV